MSKLEILDVRFYSSIDENSGYVKVKIKEETFEYDFELEGFKEEIKKMVDRKTKEGNKIEFLFEKIYESLSDNEKNEDFYAFLKNGNFNKYFVTEIEKTISKGLAKKLRNEAQIEFDEFKLVRKNFHIDCHILIFDKKFKLHFSKFTGYFTLHIEGRNSNVDSWFSNELKINKHNKGRSLFYVDPAATQDFYGIAGLIGEMIILEFKDTKYFRMSILYDDRLKNLFND
jgi:hypothetical protein